MPPPPRLPGPNELPIFLEGDESLTALAEEGTDAAQDLVKQLSAVRRSQMACWGVRENGSDKAPVVACASSGPVGDSAVGEEGVAEREHKNCMDWWQSVLGRWHEKTRLVDPSLQKKFRVVNQGPWAQIMAVLADRDRANRRSFMTESEVRADQPWRNMLGIRVNWSYKPGNGGILYLYTWCGYEVCTPVKLHGLFGPNLTVNFFSVALCRRVCRTRKDLRQFESKNPPTGTSQVRVWVEVGSMGTKYAHREYRTPGV